MRVEPSARVKRRNTIPFQVRLDSTMRIAAIVLAFLSTFVFFVKILFF
ncbi:MAG: hypothetical protein ACTHNW_16395 [Mucilaginibacter sp.]